ncbi:MAG TPA: universal stress protein [Thermoanaerobaculia bacterium]|nr:universal stress protein [Thermoanaerobaculia bacterium]HLN93410.1 universal stress protein [Thermoanaerobaculia bacterium]
MFRRILVPVDFTKNSARSVRTAGRVASGSGAEVTLLHVIERIADDETGVLRRFYHQLEKNARAKMQALLRELEEKKIPAACHVVYGNRVAEILRFAQENRTDLIVMRSHKLPLRRPTVESWGTISYKVGILSRCPVLLVK